MITRKIQIQINCADKIKRKAYLDTLYKWQRIAYSGANQVASHHFVMDNIKEMIYYEDGVKLKLDNISKSENGMLITSKMNTTYQVLSKKYKGELPMSIASGVNSVVVSTYNKERVNVFNGERSLRSYRNTMPMPAPSKNFTNWVKNDKGEYEFSFCNIPFITYFGHDRSGNVNIVEGCLSGNYKICDSSIQLTNRKTFLLLCVNIPAKKIELDNDKRAIATLDIEIPIKVTCGKDIFDIGGKEQFLHRRLQIQAALRRLQISCKYNDSGKGRKYKLQAIERFHLKEKNYVTTMLHKYSFELIKFCIDNKCGILDLIDVKEKTSKAKEDEFILRNWSYFGLLNFIRYKAQKYNISVNVL